MTGDKNTAYSARCPAGQGSLYFVLDLDVTPTFIINDRTKPACIILWIFDGRARTSTDQEVMPMYTIKELAQLAGVSARTLRWYDKIGLLKPAAVNDAGYRFYGEREVDLLQQILFYRERGMELKNIRRIIYEDDFDIMAAMEEHLRDLQEQRARIDALIGLVQRSVISMKGEDKMSDAEKFAAFKENVVKKHEEMYGAEARGKYGDKEVDDAQKKILDMSEADYERFQSLGKEIRKRLEEAVRAGISPQSEEGERIVTLHKEWLGMTWKRYTEEAHKAVANTYISDERFKIYYDREVPGCAEFLEKAVRYKIGEQ